MHNPQKPGPAKASLLLRRACNAIRREPRLRGSLTDPENVAAADLVITTMRERGVLPTALNILAQLTDDGASDERAAIMAAIVERRLQEGSRRP